MHGNEAEGHSSHQGPSALRVREVIDSLIATGTIVARSGGSVHDLFPVATTPVEGAALRGWVIRERAVSTIEIGLGYGISALHICEGLLANGDPGAYHLAVDPHQDSRFARCGLQVLEDAGLANLVIHHAEDSQVVLPRLLAAGRQFDLAFLDGNHRFEGVFVDLVYLGRLLRPGGVVFVDDYQLPGVAKAAKFFCTNLNWSVEQISTADDRHHWIVLRTSATSTDRPFDYFVDF